MAMLTTETMTTTSNPCDHCRYNSDRHCKILNVAIAKYPPCNYWYRKTPHVRGIEFNLVTIEDLIDEHKVKVVS